MARLEVGDAPDSPGGAAGTGAASGKSSGGSSSEQGGAPENAAGSDGASGMATGGVGGVGARGGNEGTASGAGGAAGSVGGAGGAGGAGGTTSRDDGPCDIYAVAATPCAAAYSTIRSLSKSYQGPLYQVRNNSSGMNTGTGGATMDIGMTADGFADADAQDAFCGETICTFSVLYDQSGNGNHLTVAPAGSSGGGMYATLPDFESNATTGGLTIAGHDVYSLHMAAREGYRLTAAGTGMPLGNASQGIYMLADATRFGGACCWEFGNVRLDPTTYGPTNSLFLGQAFWGSGEGAAPWFMANFGNEVWAGGSSGSADVNLENPSMMGVRFAFGVLKTSATQYTIRAADLQIESDLKTAWDGTAPVTFSSQGGIALGVASDNSNNSWGTFYEGAITDGRPSDETDLAVFENAQAAGYGE